MADEHVLPAHDDTDAAETKETTGEEKLESIHAEQPEAKAEEKPEEKKQDAPAEIGDDWKPALPDGAKVDEGVLTEAKGLFREMKLSPENAQKLVDFQTRQVQASQEAQRAAWESQVKAWEDGVKADPEFKQDFDAKRATAERGFRELFTPEERKYLADTGLSSYLFRAMYRAGVKVAEPSGEAEGKTGKQQQSSDPVERLSGLYGGAAKS